jgi:DNA-binding MarR family transcriptional regulator
MADVISKQKARGGRRAAALSSGAEDAVTASDDGSREDLIRLVELIFFAYRDFTQEPDAILEVYGLGRAHHRVLHFVNRRPGLRVSDLLEVLKITKQSLNRVLRPLYEAQWIEAREGLDDRRERNLFLTPKGKDLAERLLALQVARVGQAIGAASNPRHGTPATLGSSQETDVARGAVLFLKAMRTTDDET